MEMTDSAQFIFCDALGMWKWNSDLEFIEYSKAGEGNWMESKYKSRQYVQKLKAARHKDILWNLINLNLL